MKRSELKQIIREVIEESKVLEESFLFDSVGFSKEITEKLYRSTEANRRRIIGLASEYGIPIDDYYEIGDYQHDDDLLHFYQEVMTLEEQTVVSYDKLEDCPRLLMKAFKTDLYSSDQAINSHRELHQQILKNIDNEAGMLEVLKKFGETAVRKFMKEVITTTHI